MNDGDLITRYLAGDQAAFALLVSRYIDLVHASARRQAADHADDVTQAVFILLSRKAAAVRGRANLAPWLLTATRLSAARARRNDSRRRNYEREAGMRPVPDSSEDQVAFLATLDAALAQLPAKDRELVIARHLQGKALEEMAQDLGITAPAATKRVQRALERLRTIFRRRGTSVAAPTLAALLTREAAHRAPSALAASSPTAAATALANSVPTILLGGALKMTAVAALLLALAAAGAAIGLYTSPATSPVLVPVASPTVATSRAIATAPASQGDALFAAFDLVMDAAVAEKLQQAGTALETKSEHYTSYQAPNEALLEIFRDALAGNQLLAMDDRGLTFHQPKDADATPAFVFSDRYAGFHADPAGTALWASSNLLPKGTMQRTAAGLMLDATWSTIHVETWTQDINPLKSDGTVQFKGELVPGTTLFFLADVGAPAGRKLVHAIFWQAFRAQPDQVASVRRTLTPSPWILRGPDRALAEADRALVWQHSLPENTGTQPDSPANAWRTLANGAQVRVLAIGRPREFPFCWWKPDGSPASRDWTGLDVALDDAQALVVEFATPPFAHPDWSDSYYYGISDPCRYYPRAKDEVPWVLKEPLDTVKVGISCGPWTDAGKLNGPGELHQGDLRYRISKSLPIEAVHGILVPVQFQAPLELDVRLLAFDKKGNAHSQLSEDLPAGETVGIMINPPATQWQQASPNFPIPAADVDYFLVQTRPRVWTTFDHLPERPTTDIPDNVTPAQVAAVRKQLSGAPTSVQTRPASAPQ